MLRCRSMLFTSALGLLAGASVHGRPALDYLKEHGLYDRLRAEREASLYEFDRPPMAGMPKALTPKGAPYRATNPAQRLRAYFSGEQLLLEPVHGGEARGWHATFALRGYGYGSRRVSASPQRMSARGNRIEIEHAGSGRLTEWYVNHRGGLEQGFTLGEPPGARFGTEPLRVTLGVTGDVRPQLSEAGEAVELRLDGGQVALRYDHLAARDARGRELPSRLEVSGAEISLVVEEAGATYPVSIDPTFGQEAKLVASDGAQADSFGDSVAISGDTAVVGVLRADVGGNKDQGAAYVFVRNGTSWSQQQKIVAGDGAPDDSFGHTVAITGNTLVIGAPSANVGGVSNQGAAYVFVRSGTSWSLQQKLVSSDGAMNDSFGESVSIDGETLAVGASGKHIGGNFFQGAAYVFVRNGSTWSEQQRLVASDGVAHDSFGASVGISGETVVVGAFGEGFAGSTPGAAYVYVRSGTSWSEQQKLLASDGVAGDAFGGSVAVSGETAVVGALFAQIGNNPLQGAAYVFVRSGTSWSEQQKLVASDGIALDDFGISVAISGETAVVGAPAAGIGGGNANPGAAYAFVRSGTTWNQQKLVADDGVPGDQLGHSVAIDGETIVAGAFNAEIAGKPFEGAAYVFGVQVPTTLVYQGDTTADFHDPANLAAVLTDQASGQPIPNELVQFTLGSQGCTATTDGAGLASCPIILNQPAGGYTVTASFAGHGLFLPSSDSKPFTVTLEETTLTYTGPTLIPNQAGAQLSAVLKEDGITPIDGRTVTLTLGSGPTAQSCSGTTDLSGTAACTIAVLQPLGPGTVAAVFAGDAFYLPASASANTIVFAFLAGGAFVVGDQSAGGEVTFWSHDWAERNVLGGGPAPRAFKGFASDLGGATPGCGTGWTTRPGNSSRPPAAVPSFMAVLVSSSIVKHGASISGNTPAIVIVRTDQGYRSNPGHPGTGRVVARLCP